MANSSKINFNIFIWNRVCHPIITYYFFLSNYSLICIKLCKEMSGIIFIPMSNMIYDPLEYEHNEDRKIYWICSLLYLQYIVECTKETFIENLSTVRIGVMFLFQFSLLFKLFIRTMYHFNKKSPKCPSTNNWLKKMWKIYIYMLCCAVLC